jgi:hypothetical protein
MNNETAFLIGGVAGVLAVALMFLFRGVRANLSHAQIGEVYNFDYEQPLHGGTKRVLAKVVEPVTTLDDSWIRIMNKRSNYRRNDPVFKRTHHLVTCEMPNGEIRNFYAERAKNVRRTFIPGRFVRTAAAAML